MQTLIDPSMLPHTLSELTIAKLPVIGAGMVARLEAAGVVDFNGRWALAPKQARALWGNVEGERFLQELHGTHAVRDQTRKPMFGHSHVLPRDWRSPDKVEDCAKRIWNIGLSSWFVYRVTAALFNTIRGQGTRGYHLWSKVSPV